MPSESLSIDFHRVMTRRRFLGALGVGTGLAIGGSFRRAPKTYAQPMGAGSPLTAFRFVHLTDSHLGYVGDANRQVTQSLRLALQAISGLDPLPDFILMTGDLTEMTPSDIARKGRLTLFRQLIESTKLPWYAVPGEHDALLDRGTLYQSIIGDLRYGFSHKGIQFIGLDNVSRGFFLGRDQLTWVKNQVDKLDPQLPLILFCHAPLYNVFAPWNWYTYDGAELLQLLQHFSQVSIFYGHIHQLMAKETPQIYQAAGLPTSWPLPQPSELIKLRPWPQGATHPFLGLGFRVIDVSAEGRLRITNLSLSKEEEVYHAARLV